MHESVLAWADGRAIPAMRGHMHIQGKALTIQHVLEVGSLNVNGSVRPYVEAAFTPQRYVGIDVAAGPGVDHVRSVTALDPAWDGIWDLVVCTETLEHVLNWKGALRRMRTLVKPGGFLLLTTRAPGFPYHHPPDRWRFTRPLLAACMKDWLTLSLEDDGMSGHPGVLALWYKPHQRYRGRVAVSNDAPWLDRWGHHRAKRVSSATAPYDPRFLGPDQERPPWAP